MWCKRDGLGVGMREREGGKYRAARQLLGSSFVVRGGPLVIHAREIVAVRACLRRVTGMVI